MKKKVLIFDVDGTLAPHGLPVGQIVAQALCEMERRGHTVGFASGKPAAYLEGLARGIGLRQAPIIGENGAVLAGLPETVVLAERPDFFDRIQSEIELIFPKALIQHNRVNFTVLVGGDMLKAVTAHLKEAGAVRGSGFKFYFHPDSVELMPKGTDKGVALQEMAHRKGWQKDDIVAFGNAEGDMPMRGAAGAFYAVGGDIPADENFADPENLAAFLLETYK